MLTFLTHSTSNVRFIIYVALLYILALTAGTWVPASSPIFESAPFVKLALLPLAMWFLLKGSRLRWPSQFWLISLASCAFFSGVIITTIRGAFFH